MAIPARPIDPARDRDRRLAEVARGLRREHVPVPRPPARRVALHVGALVRADDMRVLIVCRGPIRKEAIDVFARWG
jgi:hypothetical protein